MDHTAQVRPGFFAQAMRRRWRFLILGALLGALAGYAASFQLPITYTSTATLFVQPLAGNPYAPDLGSTRTDQLAALDTEAELTRNPAVAALAVAQSTVALPESPEDNLSAVAESNTQVLKLSFTGASSVVASAGAQAFADAYLEYRTQQAADANAATATRLQAQVTSIAAVVEETKAALADAEPGSGQELSLQSQLGVYADSLAELRLALAEVSGPARPPGSVVSPASDGASPSGLPLWQLIAGGLAAGLVLGVLTALAREHSDDRVRDASELGAVGVGHPLAVISLSSGGVVLDEPAPSAYRLLLTGALARVGTNGSSVCVVGFDAEAVGEVAAGLAATAYRSQRTTFALGVQPAPSWGAAEILPVNTIAAGDDVDVPLGRLDGRLVVVPLDMQSAAAEELALSPSLPGFVARARDSGAIVIVRGGSIRAAAGRALARPADLTLVVVELGRDTFSAVLDEVQSLQEAGVTQVGLVAAQGRRGRGASRRSRAERTLPITSLPPGTDVPAGTSTPAAEPPAAAHAAARPATTQETARR